MSSTIVLSRATILKDYGIFFAEPYVILLNFKDPNDSDLLNRILTVYQKHHIAYTVAKASIQNLLTEKVDEKDCRWIWAKAEKKAYDTLLQECQTLLDKAGMNKQSAGINPVWIKPAYPIVTTSEELPKLD